MVGGRPTVQRLLLLSGHSTVGVLLRAKHAATLLEAAAAGTLLDAPPAEFEEPSGDANLRWNVQVRLG